MNMDYSLEKQREAVQWGSIQQAFIYRLLGGLALIGLIMIPVSAWQWQEARESFEMGVFNSVGIVSVIGLYVFRTRIPFKTLKLAICLLTTSCSLFMIWQLGLLSTGFFWFLFSAFILCIFYSLRAALIYVISFIVLTVVIAHGYINGYIIMPSATEDLAIAPSVWLLRLSVAAMGSYFMIVSVWEMKKGIFTQVEQIKRKNIEIEYLANHDPLTGLPTIRKGNDLFERLLERADQDEHKAALLFLDLDGFKSVNDTYGHDAGDEVLVNVARRVSNELRSNDTACRIGGDEFLVILNKIQSYEDVDDICRRLISVVSEPFMVSDERLEVGVSIGGAIFPDHGTTMECLRKVADEAMYSVKKSGKNNYSLAERVTTNR